MNRLTARALQSWGNVLPVGLRNRYWPAFLATLVTLAFVALLAAFAQVVRGAVEQSASRHLASKAQADAAWRCMALRAKSPRDDCAGPRDAASSGLEPRPARDRWHAWASTFKANAQVSFNEPGRAKE